jgi:hypothetical protein
MLEKATRLIELSKLIKELQEEEKAIKAELIDHVGDEGIVIDGNKITKATRSTVKLKEGVDEAEVMFEYPSAVVTTTTINIDVLRDIPEAHELLAVVETSYLQVKKAK